MPRDGNEIGLPAKAVRRKRANARVMTLTAPPASANIGTPSGDAGREGQHSAGTRPTCALSAPIGHPGNGEAGDGGRIGRDTQHSSAPVAAIGPFAGAEGEGHWMLDTQPTHALPAIIRELVSLQSHRKFCIKEQARSARSIESRIASTMGFRVDADEKDRKKLFAAAKAHRLAVEKGGEGYLFPDTQYTGALSAMSRLILVSAENRKLYDDERLAAEKQMRALAKKLPVYPFAVSVKGFGDLALAATVGEAGIAIGDYRTVSGLWKRMGLAVFDGRRQRRMTDKDQAELHGYSPGRRSQMWAFCSDSMFKHQWAGNKDEDGVNPKKSGKAAAVTAHAVGPYGEVYGQRRAHTVVRVEATADLSWNDPGKWTVARCHADAARVMTKALLRDLWRVWRGLPPRGSDSTDTPC